MKNMILKNLLILTVLLAVTSYVSNASAGSSTNTFVFGGTLGRAAKAVDVYQVGCDKTARFVAHVKGITKRGPLVSILLTNGKLSARATDKVSGDKKYSPYAAIKGRTNGQFTLHVYKSRAGVANYEAVGSCIAAKGKATGQPTLKATQNQ